MLIQLIILSNYNNFEGIQMYEKLNLIGRGANGDVFLGKNKQNETFHVIKTLKMRDITQRERQTIETQLKLLQEFKHPNIVPYRDSFIDKEGSLNIVMAYCQGGDMHNLIQNAEKKKFSEKQILDWIVQLALSIFYMHERRVLHRDIKTQNIFLTSGRVMLGDFGVSKVLDKAADLARTNIGTPYYMSPQQYRNKPYSYKSDIWAFGCIIYEMCNHRHVFQALTLQALAVKVINGAYAPVSEFYSHNLRSLVEQMLNQNPKSRPSVVQILKKPFLFKRVQNYMKEVYQQKNLYEPEQIQSLKSQAKALGISLDGEQKKVTPKVDKPLSKSKANQKRNQRSQEKLKEERQKKYRELQKHLKEEQEKRNQAEARLKEIQKMRREQNKSQKNLHHRKSYENLKSKRNSMKTQQSATSFTSSTTDRQYGTKSKPKLQDIDYQPKKSAQKISEPEPLRSKPKKAVVEEEQVKMQKFKMKEEYDMDYEEYEEQQREQLNQIHEDDDEDSEREDIAQKCEEEPQKGQIGKNEDTKKEEEAKVEVQEQINQAEESIHQLKEQVKEKTIIISNIRNQMTKLDFVISSDSEDENQNKDLNPVYTRLTEKINDLKQKLISQLGRQGYSSFLNYMIGNPQNITRDKVVNLVGLENVGVWHIAEGILRLDKVLNKVPKYVN